MIRWASLTGRVSGGARNEILKIFPSASDIAFTGMHNLPSHKVYTTYLVLDHPVYGQVIANPKGAYGRNLAVPQLNFEISNVHPYQGNNYSCTLEAYAGNRSIWQQNNVTTNGTGAMGFLNW